MTFLEIYNLSIREHVNVANDFLYKKNLFFSVISIYFAHLYTSNILLTSSR